MLAGLMFFIGCGEFKGHVAELPQTEVAVSTLRIAPQVSIVSQGDTLDFTATGGQPPFEFFMDGGLSELNSSGGYRAQGIGLEVINVRDSFGNLAHATVFIQPQMYALPQAATIVVGESRIFNVSGGVVPYTASIVSGDGQVSFDSTLVLRFTAPATAQDVVVRIEDSKGSTFDLSIDVNDALSVTPTTKTLAIGEEFSFVAEGGVPPYSFSTISGPGSIGADSGVYTGYAPGTVNLRLSDSLGHHVTMTVTNTVAALALDPAVLTLAVGNVYLMKAQGGFAPYTYSVDSGSGSIDASSGLFLAAMSAGSATLKVTDSQGTTATASVTINSALTLSPGNYDLSVEDTVNLTAADGVPPYTFAVITGGGTVNGVGLYTAPQVEGTSVVQVTDALGNVAISSLSIKPAVALSPQTSVVSPGGSTVFNVSGGIPPYIYSVLVGSGSVDSGGVYTASATPGTEQVRVEDSRGGFAVATVTVDAALNINAPYSAIAVGNSMTFTGSGGTPPYSFSIVSGSGSITTGGLYEGVAVGTATIQVQDSLGATRTKTVQINPALSISASKTFLVRDESILISQTGGVSPYTYSVLTGRGSITATTGPTATFKSSKYFVGKDTIEVRDALGNTALMEVFTTMPTAAGVNGACSIHPVTRDIYCFGQGSNGALGVGSTLTLGDNISEIGTAALPVKLGTGKKAIAITGGQYFYCAILEDHSVKCWGYNNAGQLGEGNKTSRGTTVAQLGDTLPVVNLGTGRKALSIAAGYSSVCALLDDQSIKCWGDNAYGQLGKGNTLDLGDAAGEMGDSLTAVALGTGRSALMVSAGRFHNCALLDDFSVKCWGMNSSGQLGIGSTAAKGNVANQMGDNLLAVNLGTGRKAKYIAAGHNSTCAILDNDVTKCWGSGVTGMLGIGSAVNIGDAAAEIGDNMKPVELGDNLFAVKVSVGLRTSCFLLNTGQSKCYGYNSNGQLGTASTVTLGQTAATIGNNGPFTVHGTGLGVLDIGASVGYEDTTNGVYYSQTCFFYDNMKYKCMGFNSYGGLGIGTTAAMGRTAATAGDNVPFFGMPYGY